MCKCTPYDTKCTPSQSRSQFSGQFLLGGLDLEVYLDVLLLKKRSSAFSGKKKCTPDKILATPMLPATFYRLRRYVPASAESVCSRPQTRMHDGDRILRDQLRRDARRPRKHSIDLGVLAQRCQKRRSHFRFDVMSVFAVFVVVVVRVVGRLAHRVPPRRAALQTTRAHL